jgi:hypothetical protein
MDTSLHPQQSHNNVLLRLNSRLVLSKKIDYEPVDIHDLRERTVPLYQGDIQRGNVFFLGIAFPSCRRDGRLGQQRASLVMTQPASCAITIAAGREERLYANVPWPATQLAGEFERKYGETN